MLRRWTIENFKSFRGQSNIELAPITVFAGANSSGKSTIIQTILTIKQTLQYAPFARALALNGPLTKLGTFADVLNASSPGGEIGISWELEQRPRSSFSYSPSSVAFDPSQVYYFGYLSSGTQLRTVECTLRFDSPTGASFSSPMNRTESQRSDLTELHPSLISSRLRVTSTDESGQANATEIHLTRNKQADAFDTQRQQGPAATIAEDIAQYYDVESIDQASLEDILESRAGATLSGATVRHFLPSRVRVIFDQARDRARRVASLICNRSQHLSSRSARELQDVEIPAAVIDLIAQKATESEANQFSLLPSAYGERALKLEQLLEILRGASRVRGTFSASRPIRVDLSDLQARIEEIMTSSFEQGTGSGFEDIDEVDAGASYITSFFTSLVRYLGPLRDEPRPIYPLEALANPTDVGYRGEHTAAVLDLHKDTRVTYVSPSFVDQSDMDRPPKTRATLHDAVVDWLSYLGVADDVFTGDQGKFGHQLQVKTTGVDSKHDLTNVGVGVSQILPIVVMALIADTPSLLIFEQPELHLHPKVQARLADFFLSLSLVGKQCLLETHSEYLIERFRRRIAEAPDDSLSQKLKVYFTERKSGATSCREIKISRFGAITDWPEDFFDQSQIETNLILRAGVRKREASGPKKGSDEKESRS